jgi:hypothetical protein
MTTEASCHCGAVRILVPHAPAQITDCNCSICRRLGALWAYYPAAEVRIDTAAGALDRYVRYDGPPDIADWKPLLAFIRCTTCGCVTHWAPLDPSGERMGVNARLFAPEVLAAARVRRFDGADTWRDLDETPPR